MSIATVYIIYIYIYTHIRRHTIDNISRHTQMLAYTFLNTTVRVYVCVYVCLCISWQIRAKRRKEAGSCYELEVNKSRDAELLKLLVRLLDIKQKAQRRRTYSPQLPRCTADELRDLNVEVTSVRLRVRLLLLSLKDCERSTRIYSKHFYRPIRNCVDCIRRASSAWKKANSKSATTWRLRTPNSWKDSDA